MARIAACYLLFLSRGIFGKLVLVLPLKRSQSLHLVGDTVLGVIVRCQLFPSDKTGNDAGTNNEGEDETVHMVPRWGPSFDRSAGIVIVQESEGEELSDQCVLGWEEKGWPGDSWCNHSVSITFVTDLTAIPSPL